MATIKAMDSGSYKFTVSLGRGGQAAAGGTRPKTLSNKQYRPRQK